MRRLDIIPERRCCPWDQVSDDVGQVYTYVFWCIIKLVDAFPIPEVHLDAFISYSVVYDC